VPFYESDDIQSKLPMDLMHQQTAFYQERIHDWHTYNLAMYQEGSKITYLKYHGADNNLPFIWLILVIKDVDSKY